MVSPRVIPYAAEIRQYNQPVGRRGDSRFDIDQADPEAMVGCLGSGIPDYGKGLMEIKKTVAREQQSGPDVTKADFYQA